MINNKTNRINNPQHLSNEDRFYLILRDLIQYGHLLRGPDISSSYQYYFNKKTRQQKQNSIIINNLDVIDNYFLNERTVTIQKKFSNLLEAYCGCNVLYLLYLMLYDELVGRTEHKGILEKVYCRFREFVFDIIQTPNKNNYDLLIYKVIQTVTHLICYGYVSPADMLNKLISEIVDDELISHIANNYDKINSLRSVEIQNNLHFFTLVVAAKYGKTMFKPQHRSLINEHVYLNVKRLTSFDDNIIVSLHEKDIVEMLKSIDSSHDCKIYHLAKEYFEKIGNQLVVNLEGQKYFSSTFINLYENTITLLLDEVRRRLIRLFYNSFKLMDYDNEKTIKNDIKPIIKLVKQAYNDIDIEEIVSTIFNRY